MMSSIEQKTQIEQLIDFENLLNLYSDKRYHLRSGDDWKFELIEVIKIGNEITIITDLNIDQMLSFLKRNIKVKLVLPENKLIVNKN